MTVADLIAALSALPQDYEIAVLTHTAFARPPTIEPVNQWAWQIEGSGPRGGLAQPDRAFLIRPARDVV